MARKTASRNLSSLLDQIRSNLPNFLLGLTILIVFVLLSSLYFQGSKKTIAPEKKQAKVVKPTEKKAGQKNRSLWEIILGKKEEKPTERPVRKHMVKEGESLWVIAEQYYGSGYNAYDIAQTNKIENPDVIEVGVVLTIPEMQAKIPTQGDVGATMTDRVTIPGSEYVVKEGDSLWTVAQGAYGDGYAWLRIAQANNLSNPDVINPGQKLSLPR